MTFAEKLKIARENAGLTQKELAEKLNVSTAAVSKWENGKGFPDISILENLSAVVRSFCSKKSTD